jgi:hypothetical protein
MAPINRPIDGASRGEEPRPRSGEDYKGSPDTTQSQPTWREFAEKQARSADPSVRSLVNVMRGDSAWPWDASLDEQARRLREQHHAPFPVAAALRSLYGIWRIRHGGREEVRG